MAQDIARVSLSPRGLTSGADTLLWVSPSGAAVTLDFLTASILDGHGFQMRGGLLTTPIVADIEVTTVAAEAAVSSAAGQVLMPTRFHFDMESLNGGTLPQTSVKMTTTAASGGTAFTPLPLLTGGRASWLTALVNDAGGVTVVDDAATTTRALYSSTQAAVGNWPVDVSLLGRGIVNGAGDVYLAVGSVTAGVQYFFALDWLEFTTGQLGL